MRKEGGERSGGGPGGRDVERGNAREGGRRAVRQKDDAGWLDIRKSKSRKWERMRRRMKKDIHVWPPAVCVSQQQQLVRTENDGKSARRLGEVPQPLTLSERNPSQQEADRKEKGVWDKSEFKPDRRLERRLSELGRLWFINGEPTVNFTMKTREAKEALRRGGGTEF